MYRRRFSLAGGLGSFRIPALLCIAVLCALTAFPACLEESDLRSQTCSVGDQTWECEGFWADITAQELRERIASGEIDVHAYSEGHTALMLAARLSADPEIIRVFVEAGADVRAVQQSGPDWSVLTGAIRFNPNISPEMLNILIRAGADIHKENMAEWTALMIASHSAGEPIVRSLIQAGAQVNAQSGIGMNALMIAAESNSDPQVILRLLEAGADTTVRNWDGLSAWNLIQGNQALKETEAYEELLSRLSQLP